MTSATPRACSLHITGTVQGVSFRAYCADQARSLGVSGFVQNEDDESVSVWAQGDPDAVEALIDWCHEGPTGAHVADVEVRDVAPRDLTGFEILRGTDRE